jgi:hypothetical protein
MSTKVRATFLIVAAAFVFHLSYFASVILVAGYWISADVDQRLTKRARIKAIEEVIEDETSGWEKDPDDPEWEEKGDATRIKLPANEQIVVTRVAEILRRLEHARKQKSLGGIF